MQFKTINVLEVVSGMKLTTEPGISGAQEIYSFLMGRDVFTHELPIIGDHMEPILLDRYPDLKTSVEIVKQVNPDNALEIIRNVMATLPEMFELLPLLDSEKPTNTHRLLEGKEIIVLSV